MRSKLDSDDKPIPQIDQTIYDPNWEDEGVQARWNEFVSATAPDFNTQLASISNLSLQGYGLNDAVELSMTLAVYYSLSDDDRIKAQQAWIYPSDSDTGQHSARLGAPSLSPIWGFVRVLLSPPPLRVATKGLDDTI